MKFGYQLFIYTAIAYVFISGRSFDTLVVAISFCIGGWVSCYFSWIKLNRGIEKGTYDAPLGEDAAIILSSILLPMMFSIFISAVYVFINDINTMIGLTIQITKSLLAIVGFTIGLLSFLWIFWGGIKKNIE